MSCRLMQCRLRHTRIIASLYPAVVFSLVFALVMPLSTTVRADADPMSPMYELSKDKGPARTDLSTRPLAGKVLRYGYHSFWEVNKDKGPQPTPAAMQHDIVFYENGECEWYALDIFLGEHVRSMCGTVELAPNLYLVNWLEEESEQVVVQVVNLETWTINSTFHFNNGKGLAMFEGDILFFGDYPETPVTLPSEYEALYGNNGNRGVNE